MTGRPLLHGGQVDAAHEAPPEAADPVRAVRVASSMRDRGFERLDGWVPRTVLEPLDHPLVLARFIRHAEALQATTLRASASNAARKLRAA